MDNNTSERLFSRWCTNKKGENGDDVLTRHPIYRKDMKTC